MVAGVRGGTMTIEEVRLSPVLRGLLWGVLAVHVAALVGFGPAHWFDVWYMRIAWCTGLLTATVMITGDWIARRCSPRLVS